MNVDLFFGLIAPLGTPLDTIEESLRSQLTALGHNVITVHLSAIIEKLYQEHYFPESTGGFSFESVGNLERIRLLQDGGDAVRIDAQRGDILALAVIAHIAHLRAQRSNTPCAYLIRSLKHPDELALFRQIYRDRFYAISAFSSRQRRIAHLKKNAPNCESSDLQAHMLVDRDYRRGHQEIADDQLDALFSTHWFAKRCANRTLAELRAFGQQLQGTFHQADLFVDTSQTKLTERHIERFAHIILGHPFSTPTKEEFAMFQAKSTSLRSADLSRQVGAVIVTKSGDVIASGANEVPKFGGGLHWTRSDLDEQGESRDFRFFADGEIDALRMTQLTKVLIHLVKEGWQFSKEGESLDQKSVVDALGKRLRQLHISQMGEFGRTVHAEMAALMDAVSRGVCVRDQIAYVTTFPCHQCAKHLIAAGIRQVVFIEPYPKSETVKLWPSEVANFELDETAGADQMRLLPFVGIAPRRYFDFFLFEPKKDPEELNREACAESLNGILRMGAVLKAGPLAITPI